MTRISQVATVFVPVADQDRALQFYVDQLGFRVTADARYGGGIRWVEVAPEGSAHALALVPRAEGTPVRGDQAVCALPSADINGDHAALLAAGVDVDPEIARPGGSRPGLMSLEVTVHDPASAMFSFRDPDGNRFLVVDGA